MSTKLGTSKNLRLECWVRWIRPFDPGLLAIRFWNVHSQSLPGIAIDVFEGVQLYYAQQPRYNNFLNGSCGHEVGACRWFSSR